MPNASLDPAILSIWEAKRRETMFTGCYVCGHEKCKLITHRHYEHALLRSLSRQVHDNQHYPDFDPESDSESAADDSPKKSLALRGPDTPVYMPLNTYYTSDLPGVPSLVAKSFHDYLTRQGRDIRDPDKGLYFNIDAYPFIFPVAMGHPGLLASYAAMAVTFAGVHGRQLTAPDAEVLTMHNYCFQILRRQIEKERRTSRVSEPSVLAAINLVTCCGLAFADKDTTLTHWEGVNSLYYSTNHVFHSGALISYFEGLEYLIVLYTGVLPSTTHERQWPTVAALKPTPINHYGIAFRGLLQAPLMEGLLTSRLSEICLNTCRATVELEEQGRKIRLQLKKPSNDYFMHLRGALVQQYMMTYTVLNGTDTLAECVSICINLFYCCVLRMMPYPAPLRHLCQQLLRVMRSCRHLSDTSKLIYYVKDDMYVLGMDEDDLLLRDLYLWILYIYACASRLGQDEPNVDEADRRIQQMLVVNLADENRTWEQAVLQRLRQFCWSNVFLDKFFKETCSAVELMGLAFQSGYTSSLTLPFVNRRPSN